MKKYGYKDKNKIIVHILLIIGAIVYDRSFCMDYTDIF